MKSLFDFTIKRKATQEEWKRLTVDLPESWISWRILSASASRSCRNWARRAFSSFRVFTLFFRVDISSCERQLSLFMFFHQLSSCEFFAVVVVCPWLYSNYENKEIMVPMYILRSRIYLMGRCWSITVNERTTLSTRQRTPE